ncbi:MAG TPA: hypothetical protein VG500_21170 [Gemmatimonadales bacterium]|nr:hypothetical protein [Gemmatimonadales bacterium]
MSPARLLVVLAGAALAGPLRAQDTAAVPQAADTTAQAYAPAGAAAHVPTIAEQLGFVEVLPTRSADRIRADLDDARSDERAADAEVARHNDEKERTKAMVEVKKREISTLDARRKLAEKSKQETDKVMLQAEKKDAERYKEFLERRVQLHEAEADQAEAARSLAQATRRKLDLELQLTERRAERERTAGLDAAATRRHDAVIAELETKVLDADRKRAEAQKRLADKDVNLARRRTELHKAQAAVIGR